MRNSSLFNLPSPCFNSTGEQQFCAVVVASTTPDTALPQTPAENFTLAPAPQPSRAADSASLSPAARTEGSGLPHTPASCPPGSRRSNRGVLHKTRRAPISHPGAQPARGGRPRSSVPPFRQRWYLRQMLKVTEPNPNVTERVLFGTLRTGSAKKWSEFGLSQSSSPLQRRGQVIGPLIEMLSWRIDITSQ